MNLIYIVHEKYPKKFYFQLQQLSIPYKHLINKFTYSIINIILQTSQILISPKPNYKINYLYNLKITHSQMINDINIDKILERQQNGNIFLVHIVATPERLSIEIQDKLKGDIWAEEFSLQKIEEITLKAKNAKKYPIFIKMLMSSLMGQTESVTLEILTFAELQRKMNLASSKGRTIQQQNRKFIIMTYLSEFDKTNYPLPLSYIENPPVQRLKITIRRLAQELTLNGEERHQPRSYEAKQFSMLKYENQTLKTRIKTLEQRLHTFTQGSENLMDKSNLMNEQKQTKKELQGMKSLLTAKQQQITQLRNKLKQIMTDNQKKENLIIDLKQQLNDYKEERNQKRQQQQTYALVEEKINQMNKETSELVSELQFFKEKDKKNSLKIQNLQKQLQKMMTLQQKKRQGGGGTLPNASSLAFSRKAPSQKSFTSQKSNKSNQSGRSNNSKTKGGFQGYNNKPNQPINRQTTKRSSIYDSDTESSKLRKANNSKVSPFRQPVSKPSGNVSNSSKRASNNFTSTTNRFERNILSRNRDRSRSKSRSVKKNNSPPAEIPTDNFASSSEDEKQITEVLTKLKERKNRVKGNESKNQGGSAMGPLERKITNIAEMLRRARSREGRD